MEPRRCLQKPGAKVSEANTALAALAIDTSEGRAFVKRYGKSHAPLCECFELAALVVFCVGAATEMRLRRSLYQKKAHERLPKLTF